MLRVGEVVLKTLMDVTIAIVALLLLSPVLILISFILLLNLRESSLFVQERPGLCGKPFRLLKFKTMKTISDANAELLPNALRVTKLGTLLRRLSLDELPSLINVLKGEMSIVGPRPLKLEYLPLYSDEQARRHDVKPGITGWAQINGRNSLGWEDRFRLDVWYVDNHNIFLDLRIIFLTFFKLLGSNDVDYITDEKSDRFLGGKR